MSNNQQAIFGTNMFDNRHVAERKAQPCLAQAMHPRKGKTTVPWHGLEFTKNTVMPKFSEQDPM
jgi:hypothetical protein